MESGLAFRSLFKDRVPLWFNVVVVLGVCAALSPTDADQVVSPAGRQDDGYNVHIYGHIGQTDYSLISPTAPYAQLQIVAAGPGETAVGGAIMHFPLAGVPQQIVSATLRCYLDYFMAFDVHHINANVANDVALWEVEAPQTTVFRFWDGSGTVHSAWVEADVTEAVRQDLALGRAFSAFNFTSVNARLYLSESGEFGPSLTIVPIPEPSSLVALAAGLAGLAAVRPRRRR